MPIRIQGGGVEIMLNGSRVHVRTATFETPPAREEMPRAVLDRLLEEDETPSEDPWHDWGMK
jgi:hypothetical protein